MAWRLRHVRCSVLVVLCLVSGVQTAWAQDGPDGFLLKSPVGAVSFRGGMNRATAGSDVFSFVTRELTLDRSDFRAMTVAADAGVGITPRLGWVAGFSFARSKAPSEFRDWLDNSDLPIEQSTALTRLSVTASLKTYLRSPGRAIGRFAWIPARYAPYVGAGGGLMRYEFAQKGDFIDFNTFKVFYDNYASSGLRPMAQAFAGLDVSLTPRIAFTTEGRYEWATAELDTDFSGFEPIDLSGVSFTAGFSIRY
jgi:hypothetical protein